MVFLALVGQSCFADKEDATEQQLDELRTRIQALQADIEAVGHQHDDELARLAAIEREIGVLGRSLHEIDQSLLTSAEKLEKLRTQARSLQYSLAEQNEALAIQLRAAYVMGRQERLKLLFNQQDAGAVGRVLTYYEYFNQQRVQRLKIINAQLRQLQETQASIVQAEQADIVLREAKRQERDALKRHQQDRQRAIAALAARMQAGGSELQALQQDEQQLETLLRGIRQALDDVITEMPGHEEFTSLKGRLPWPTRGKLQAKFGTSRIGELKWDGVMIAAPEGTEVRAVHRGRVAYADWLRGFGLLMIIDHGEGYMSLYGYNQSLYKETGDWVEGGEPVSSVGRSGGRDKAAVYFGIRSKGRAINPKKWCRKTKGSSVG